MAVESRIVLVDDCSDTRALLSLILEIEGWSVETFEDAEAALRSIRSAPPALVLTDMNLLEGMNGAELAEALHADPATRDVAVIALTGHVPSAAPEWRRFAKVFVKPVDPRALARALAELRDAGAAAAQA